MNRYLFIIDERRFRSHTVAVVGVAHGTAVGLHKFRYLGLWTQATKNAFYRKLCDSDCTTDREGCVKIHCIEKSRPKSFVSGGGIWNLLPCHSGPSICGLDSENTRSNGQPE